jgi:predicted CoA-binding protein
MATIDLLVHDFLNQKRIAVAGVSHKQDDAANLIYNKLKKSGYTVYPVNPSFDRFKGDCCYPNLKSLPEQVDGVVIVTRPEVTEKIVREVIQLGIPRVWMHCSLGCQMKHSTSFGKRMTSVSAEAVRLCRENHVEVIHGGCPLMFARPVDFGHTLMRWVLRLSGRMDAWAYIQ